MADESVQAIIEALQAGSRLLLDLEGLEDPGFGAEEPWSAADDEAVWQRVRDGLRQEPAPVVPFPDVSSGRLPAPPRWLQVLAAALLRSP